MLTPSSITSAHSLQQYKARPRLVTPRTGFRPVRVVADTGVAWSGIAIPTIMACCLVMCSAGALDCDQAAHIARRGNLSLLGRADRGKMHWGAL